MSWNQFVGHPELSPIDVPEFLIEKMPLRIYDDTNFTY